MVSVTQKYFDTPCKRIKILFFAKL